MLPDAMQVSTTAAPHALAVEAVGVTKRFGPLTALDAVSMKVEAGSFHCLLGENGAGKSTLVKCLVGYHPPEEGSFIVDDREQEIRSPRDARCLGIGMVYQHFTLAPGLTVAENLLLARGDLPPVLSWKKELAGLTAFLDTTPFRLGLNSRVADLAAGEKQKLEILKQLYLGQKLLILDEPTSVLTPGEAADVLGLLHAMTREQRLTILMITHKFREVTAYADSVTILRRGRLAGSGLVSGMSTAEMAEMMVGSAVTVGMGMGMGGAENGQPARRQSATPGAVKLQIEGLVADNDRGTAAVCNLGLDIHDGEIVGIAGVAGNGQKELVEVLLGQRQARAGRVRVGNEDYRAERAQMRRHGVYSLPEEPLKNACVPNMSVAENMALRNFDVAPFSGGWRSLRRLRRAAILARARELIEAFGVRPPNPATAIENLSGGNVQRAVLARELSQSVQLLVVANPVFGLDFAATEAIHRRLDDARNNGAAILLVSEDLDELLELADRILVMSEGRITHATTAAAADVGVIGSHMAGHGH
jgi:simple sugar transport system ATP-binding protein